MNVRWGRAALVALVAGGLVACTQPADHFRQAQELIARIEADNPSAQPNYADYRYDDVLVHLAKVAPDDPNYWKAREWTQNIKEAREAALKAMKEGGEAVPDDRGGQPVDLGFARPPAEEPESEDLLEPSPDEPPADIELMRLSLSLGDDGARAEGVLWNKMKRAHRIQVSLVALGPGGVEMTRTTGLTMGPEVAPGDRASFRVFLGAYDPGQEVLGADEPTPEGGGSAAPLPNVLPYDPSQTTRLRLEFETTEGRPLTWVDSRPDRPRPKVEE